MDRRGKIITQDKDKLARREARFKAGSSERNLPQQRTLHSTKSVNSENLKPEDLEQQIIGTCEMLEKCYLRLTSAPKASEVRPRHVLVKALEKVKEIWDQDSDYRRASEQLKSIRQDMLVQGIRDELTIDVYETHARLAIQSRDPFELNVCQSVLITLYDDVAGGDTNKDEFTAYRILYYLYTRDFTDLTKLVSNAAREENGPCLTHALAVAMAWVLGAYHSLFNLYTTAPLLSSSVMDLFLDRERATYLKILMTAYRPHVPTTFVTSELKLVKNEKTNFFSKNGIVFVEGAPDKIDCKATLDRLRGSRR